MSESIIAQKGPYATQLVEGEKYAWCACGRSANQPFCDGSHSVTDITPILYKADKTKDVWYCGCKQSGKKPFCDGTHTKL